MHGPMCISSDIANRYRSSDVISAIRSWLSDGAWLENSLIVHIAEAARERIDEFVGTDICAMKWLLDE